MNQPERVFAPARCVFGFGKVAFANHRGDGELLGVSEADFEASQGDSLGPGSPAPVEEDKRLPASVREDFDIPPADAAHARPQRLHDRLFRRETGGEFGDSPPAMPDLIVRVNAPKEAIPVPRDHVGDPVNFNDVDSYSELRGHDGPWYGTPPLGAWPHCRRTLRP